MAVKDSSVEKALEMIDAQKRYFDFVNKLSYEKRYFLTHEILDYIKEYSDVGTICISQGNILYRARICNDEIMQNLHISRYEKPFCGYSAKESFAPTNLDAIKDGRANPLYIRYLYTAEDAYTAISEVRPIKKSFISVAEINVNKELKLLDLAVDDITSNIHSIINIINVNFSRPFNGEQKSYLPTQYISEYIKSIGFDGIRFNSSLSENGKNVTIFYPNLCSPISSSIYEVLDINYVIKKLE